MVDAFTRVDTGVDSKTFSASFDPTLIRSARRIYDTYFSAHPETERPLGVAINRVTHRGKLIFSSKPILLPEECFVPFELIDSSTY